MLTVTLRQLELADFGDSNVIRRGKYVELCELLFKSYEMKIKHVSLVTYKLGFICVLIK